MSLSSRAANDIYDVLVEICEASESDRDYFVERQTSTHITEWRFMGNLGMGGKFWRQGNLWYVNAYPEGMTPDKEAIIKATNRKLERLRERHRD